MISRRGTERGGTDTVVCFEERGILKMDLYPGGRIFLRLFALGVNTHHFSLMKGEVLAKTSGF